MYPQSQKIGKRNDLNLWEQENQNDKQLGTVNFNDKYINDVFINALYCLKN